MKRFANDAAWLKGEKKGIKMKRAPILAALFVLAAAIPFPCKAAPEEGVALSIIYDTSGSMRENVHDNSGKSSPKYVIANRSLMAIADQIQAFATNTTSGTPRRIDAGLFIFDKDGAREVVKFGPFDPAAIKNWAKNF